MPRVNEEAVQQAIEGLNTGQYSSIRAAARAYAIERITLADRIRGVSMRTQVCQQQQLLSTTQE
jgi:hypothetical protein